MTATLTTTVRENLGSRDSRRLRLQGKIPCILQGEGAHVNVTIVQDEFLAARRHHEHVFELAIPGGAETAMVRELQWDAFGERIIHVEFHRVDLTKETEAEVGIEFAGHPKGGVLNHLMTHVTVAAVPALIPDEIEVNVAELEIGHPLLVSDLPCPEGVRIVTPGDEQVAVVVTVRAEVVAEEEDEEGAEGEAAEGEAAAPAEKPEGEA
jgi:large subunit ribosomal protein L25